MKIAQVVTLASVDGAFGGPLGVARAQLRELSRRGHQLTVFAGWDGLATIDVPESVEVRLYLAHQIIPKTGFSGLLAPRMLLDLWRELRDFDLVHIHLGRDLISSTAARFARLRGIPYVVQTHGMIIPDFRLRAKAFDRLIIRDVLLGAKIVFSLTATEDVALKAVVGEANIQRLTNGIYAPPHKVAPRRNPTPDVLFCARLHARKRVLVFLEMARLLLDRGVQATFSIVGPDEGDLPALLRRIREKGLDKSVKYEGAIAPSYVTRRLAKADVFVLPSVNEPFPMTVLEALAAGTPTVITDSCQISADLAFRKAAIVTDGSPEQLAVAIEELLNNPTASKQMAERGLAAVQEFYSIGAVVDQLEEVYAGTVALHE